MNCNVFFTIRKGPNPAEKHITLASITNWAQLAYNSRFISLVKCTSPRQITLNSLLLSSLNPAPLSSALPKHISWWMAEALFLAKTLHSVVLMEACKASHNKPDSHWLKHSLCLSPSSNWLSLTLNLTRIMKSHLPFNGINNSLYKHKWILRVKMSSKRVFTTTLAFFFFKQHEPGGFYCAWWRSLLPIKLMSVWHGHLYVLYNKTLSAFPTAVNHPSFK